MSNYRANTPDFIILSSDPPSPFSLAFGAGRKPTARMSTGGKAPRRAKTPLDDSYDWPVRAIIKKSTLHYLIDFLPARLTPAEHYYWASREEFASDGIMVRSRKEKALQDALLTSCITSPRSPTYQEADGRIPVTFWPSWQLHENASEHLVELWSSRYWEEVILLPEDL
ncbi:hypothetical protein P7C70_g3883, partial [Phenoliferia sp. Uapishka_3]